MAASGCQEAEPVVSSGGLFMVAILSRLKLSKLI